MKEEVTADETGQFFFVDMYYICIFVFFYIDLLPGKPETPDPTPSPKSALNAKELDALNSSEKRLGVCFLICMQLRTENPFKRSVTSVSMASDGTGEMDAQPLVKGTTRVRVLTEDERARIQAMTHPSQMDHAERKRQYAALDRRMKDWDIVMLFS